MMREKFINIGSVAKYEAKLLSRSWFFKIYLALVVGIAVSGAMYLGDQPYYFENITTLIPYAAVLILNILQSFIVIFMSADYLKRDKELDTSEVFYVRPLTNAEYLFGKVLGTMRPFLIVNLALIFVTYVLVKFGFGIECRLWDFFSYFLIIIIPSLIFFIGVSTAMMLIIGNQAITYLVMLGLSGVSLFYTGSYADYLFDLFMIHLPQARSDVMGVSNLGMIINHRIIYIMVGLSSMTLSIYLFHRLAGSRRLQNIFLMISIGLFALSGIVVTQYYIKSLAPAHLAERMMELNGQYAGSPTLEIDHYDLEVKQLPNSIETVMRVDGVVSMSSNELLFNLNGGMKLREVTLADATPLKFKRIQHLIVVELGRTVQRDEALSLCFKYDGTINEDEMYIDIEDKNINFKSSYYDMLNFDKRVAYVEPEWVVLTPESGWYVRSGVTYTDRNSNWRHEQFSSFDLRVTPLEGMTPVSQGDPERMADSVRYRFAPENPLRAMSLAISRYERYNAKIGKIDYSLYIHETNRNHIEVMRPVVDTLPTIIEDAMGDFERNSGIEYHLPRLTIVDVPEQIYSYKRNWSSTQEIAQPELFLLPGAGMSPIQQMRTMSGYSVASNYKRRQDRIKKNKSKRASEAEMLGDNIRWIFGSWNTMDSRSITRTPGGIVTDDIPNPHYLPSVLFNSKNNIVSDSLSWGNRLMEMYYMGFIDGAMSKDSGSRGRLGMSDYEQVLVMLQQDGCDRYLADPEYSKFITEIIIAQGNALFAEAMSKMGADEFVETIREIIDNQTYNNVNINQMLDSVAVRSGFDARENLKFVNKTMQLPSYFIGGQKLERGLIDDEIMYSTEIVLRNESDIEGFVELIYDTKDEKEKLVVKMEPRQIKRVVKQTPLVPRLTVNTMNSNNIPQYRRLGSVKLTEPMMPSNNDKNMSPVKRGGNNNRTMSRSRGNRGGGGSGSEHYSILPEEGEYILEEFDTSVPNEIIVDDNDEGLFEVSAPPMSGFLNRWIDETSDNDMKYKSSSGQRPNFKWTLTSGTQFNGDVVQSGWQIRSGDGDQYVRWKVPVERGQRYALYFSTTTPWEVSHHNKSRDKYKGKDLSYRFSVETGDEYGASDMKYDFRKMGRISGGPFAWEWIGDYEAKQDTIYIKLTNKSDIQRISADAVKVVKMERAERVRQTVDLTKRQEEQEAKEREQQEAREKREQQRAEQQNGDQKQGDKKGNQQGKPKQSDQKQSDQKQGDQKGGESQQTKAKGTQSNNKQ
ncbi:MAG: ABC transporter permease subunit [Rikenellaceae bacterium]